MKQAYNKQFKQLRGLSLFGLLLMAYTLLGTSAFAQTTTSLDARTILARATEATGGDEWANAKTLILTGRAVFWGKEGAEPTSSPDRYVMYRELDPNRQAAHGAEGKLRIIVSDKGKPVWTVGYDGADTWTDKGVMPRAEADKMWANNFGFGIIRHALKPGFKSVRLADGNVDGHAVFMVQLIDPTGTESLFGIDQKDYAIRMVGFLTPRGWHVRTYDNFFRPTSMPRWLQAGKVTLYYNGVKQNEIHWTSVEINVPIEANIFAAPDAMRALSKGKTDK